MSEAALDQHESVQAQVSSPATARAQAERSHATAWVWQVTLLSILLGILLAMALRTQWQARKDGVPNYSRFDNGAALGSLMQANRKLEAEIQKQRSQLKEYQDTRAEGADNSEAVQKMLQQSRFYAGLTPVVGPGLKITLQDSPLTPPDVPRENLIIHDKDINAILDELKAAGAEAIALAGADENFKQRVGARTTARCAGPGMMVNDAKLGAPYRIYAIGNPAELRSQLEMTGGIVKESGLLDFQMITIEDVKSLRVPAHTGSSSFRYAQPVEEPANRE